MRHKRPALLSSATVCQCGSTFYPNGEQSYSLPDGSTVKPPPDGFTVCDGCIRRAIIDAETLAAHGWEPAGDIA